MFVCVCLSVCRSVCVQPPRPRFFLRNTGQSYVDLDFGMLYLVTWSEKM